MNHPRDISDLENELDGAIARKQRYLADVIHAAETEIESLKALLEYLPSIALLQAGHEASGHPIVKSINFYSGKCVIYCYPPSFTVCDDSALADLIAEVEDLGGETTSDDHPDENYRAYRNRFFAIYAYPREDATCQRVVTGVTRKTVSKLVEVEVDEPSYAFKC